MAKVVGITGTRDGLTRSQYKKAMLILHKLETKALHHGDCLGVDQELAEAAQIWGVRLYSHPPVERRHRAFVQSFEVFKPRPYLERNQNIVDCCQVLVACPKGFVEELRSGTWSTIRYARRVHRPLVIVWPDGTHTVERP